MSAATTSSGEWAGAPVLRLGPPAISEPELFRRFESIGNDCEFGFVQRFAGAEPLGLFRFARVATEPFIEALAARLDGVDDPDRIEIFEDRGTQEWLGRMGAYGFVFHTGQYAGQVAAETVHAEQGRRQRLLKRLFLQQLDQPRRIFVRCRTGVEDDMRAVSAAIGAHGPGTVLWVTLSTTDRPAGTVERLSPTLLRGYIDRFWVAIGTRFDILTRQWVAVCRNAWRMTEVLPDLPALPPPVLPLHPNLLLGEHRQDGEHVRSVPLADGNGHAHLLLAATAFPHCSASLVRVATALRPGRVHVFGAEVCIPHAFAGSAVSAVFMGLPAIQYVAADLSVRDRWQLIWVTARSPADAAVAVSLFVIGAPGDGILSRRWRLEEGSCLFDPAPAA